ncbi:MAG: undecaprenyldiphospho-muramoylpentapeptide beta-N-acetylglucosaminyltransferase [Bacteroidetes bacterium]|nr:undecaprenyldiphospho-muramoylpentapeptide beta-N-acetylglucosaminyltransferase [Bacteroidota bacterium]NCQ11576.1 undecaprenyldiphospho-muramoylpentapeptide beta-N-acetylglucosaminyltransferase [Bacteroidota bacterium]
MSTLSTYKIVLAAGGTGGHVFPAIAIADALRDTGKSVHLQFIGTKDKMEFVAVPRAGYEIHDIWISGFHRNFTLKNLLFPFKLLRSLLQTRRILKKIQPDLIVACGGYVAGPVGYVANKLKIPVVLQEQNSLPGVTNRLLASKADLIFTAFEQADDFFPKKKTRLLGNPTRKALLKKVGNEAFVAFGFSPNKPTLLVLGGSLGARAINETVRHNLDLLHNEMGLQILWQCGTRFYDSLIKEVPIKNYDNLRLVSFLDNMPFAYGISDLVVSRAGASSCAELLVTGKPSILVPSPYVAGDHQTYNAKAMVENGAAIMLRDHELSSLFVSTVKDVIFDSEQLERMSALAFSLAKPDAAKEIADQILHLIDSKSN